MNGYFIGLISGTSMDGIDAVLVEFASDDMSLVATHEAAYPDDLRETLAAATRDPAGFDIDTFGELDTRVGACFRDAALQLLDSAGVAAGDVVAIGSHGQTVRHRPDAQHPFTLQVGDASIIATGTGIETVADFRRADVALGGQGAPLVPPFHRWRFGDPSTHRAILNVGGVANLTLLPAGDGRVTGFDTGPGNSLMDLWARRHLGRRYDDGGRWAATGSVNRQLLDAMLADDWFGEPPPKSTGFEYFNAGWIDRFATKDIAAESVQSTLCELTAASVAADLLCFCPSTTELYVCGGGAHNVELLNRLASRLPGVGVATTGDLGLDGDWVEAAAFAWLARQRLLGLPGSLASVTGARRDTVLGAVHKPRVTAK